MSASSNQKAFSSKKSVTTTTVRTVETVSIREESRLYSPSTLIASDGPFGRDRITKHGSDYKTDFSLFSTNLKSSKFSNGPTNSTYSHKGVVKGSLVPTRTSPSVPVSQRPTYQSFAPVSSGRYLPDKQIVSYTSPYRGTTVTLPNRKEEFNRSKSDYNRSINPPFNWYGQLNSPKATPSSIPKNETITKKVVTILPPPKPLFRQNTSPEVKFTSTTKPRSFSSTRIPLELSYPKQYDNSVPNLNRLQITSRLSKRNQPKSGEGPGIVYIINHESFDTPENRKRSGSLEDVKLLQQTFQKFNLKVVFLLDLTVNGVKKEVKKIEEKDFSKRSCIVIAILSHGNRMERISARDGTYSIDDDVLFPILRNKTLESKPKIFIIQSCKGDVDLRDYKTDATQHAIGNPSEIIKCYSTFEGYVSYLSLKGSIFIRALCELIQKHGSTKNIKEIMEMCIPEVKRQTKDLQVPTMSTTFTKPYVFGHYA